MNLGARLDRFWYPNAPAERLAMLRILVGAFALVYLAVRYPSLTAVTRFHVAEFTPTGPVSLLRTPLHDSLVHAIAVIGILSGLAFVLGFRYRVLGPLFAISFLWITSYRSSWGMKFHTENLVSLHLIVLAVAPAADVFSLDARRRGAPGAVEHGRYGWPIVAMCAITAAAYVLAGVAKLRLSGLDWANGEILRAQVAYDNLRKIELGSLHSPIGAALVGVGWPFRALSWATLALELGAPLALFGRRLATIWACSAFAFHLGVLALMAIAFPYQLSFIAFLSFFRVERARSSRPYQWLSHRVQNLARAMDGRSVARD